MWLTPESPAVPTVAGAYLGSMLPVSITEAFLLGDFRLNLGHRQVESLFLTVCASSSSISSRNRPSVCS